MWHVRTSNSTVPRSCLSQVKTKIKNGVLSFPATSILGLSLHQRFRGAPALGPGDVSLLIAALAKCGSREIRVFLTQEFSLIAPNKMMGDPGFHVADSAWNNLSFPVPVHVMLQLFEVNRKKFNF